MNQFKMHQYILGGVGLFLAFAATLPIAMMRVSKTDKFAEQPFTSLTCEGQQPPGREVVTFETCAQMQAKPVIHANLSHPAQPVQLVAQSQVAQSQTEAPSRSTVVSPAAIKQADPFVQAFRIAEQAVANGKIAKTSTDWRNTASQWQQATDLMHQVPPDDPRHAIAQDRIALYQKNRQTVLQRANRTPF